MKYFAVIISSACFSVAQGAAASTAVAASSPTAMVQTSSLPLSFEPNRGQTDAYVDFVARGSGYTLFLSSTSATFVLQRETAEHQRSKNTASIRMDVLGANSHASMDAEEVLPGSANYIPARGSDSAITGLPTYAKTRVQQIYPKIDLVYYGTQGQLEYDFVVASMTDPQQIRLKFAGAKPVIADNGDLLLTQEKGDAASAVRLLKPVAYQEYGGTRVKVPGTYTLTSNHTVGFRVGRYDHSRTLVIDPVLLYSSYIGGSSLSTMPGGIAVNAARESYITGTTSAIDYPTTPGVLFPKCPAPVAGATKCGASSPSAAFVSKISADGKSLIYSTYLGGNSVDTAVGIAVGANDEAWVVGGTDSPNFPITSDAYQPYCTPIPSGTTGYGDATGKKSGCPGASSIYLVKLNPTGTSILYGTFLGGSQGATAAGVALDASGNVYIGGTAATLNNLPFASGGQYQYPTTSSAYQSAGYAGETGLSAFVTELSADGHSLVYSSFFAASAGQTLGTALAVGNGLIFVGGYTQTQTLPTTAGALSRTCPNSNNVCASNAFVAEFDPTKSGAASLVFSTYLNGVQVSPNGVAYATSQVESLAADASGNVYVGGSDHYVDFPTTAGSLMPTCYSNGGGQYCQTGFVTKLSSVGSLVWSTFYGSPSGASGTFNIPAMALDLNDNVYIAGNAAGAGDIPLGTAASPFYSAYIAEISNDGSRVLYGTFYGGNVTNTYPTGIAVDSVNNIHLAGYTTSLGTEVVNAFQSTAAGGYDEGFFAEIARAVGADSGAAGEQLDHFSEGRSDYTVWRPSTGYWYSNDGAGHESSALWGVATDLPVLGDFDGDGKADLAVYRPLTGDWYIVQSSNDQVVMHQWGVATDVPVAGDFDGDGKTDIAVWRPATGYWYITESSSGQIVSKEWGLPTDVPVVGDFDGDGKSDIAVWRPSTGYWYIVQSSTNEIVTQQWGAPTDIPVTGDFDGDGKSDIAVYRPSTGYWYITLSSTGEVMSKQWGEIGDIPVARDYDGDSKTDIAVWRPSTGTWYAIQSSNGAVLTTQWGVPTDIPVNNLSR